ncbi:MAG: aldo/keto reductase [Anaerolineaceae bacterium]|nr:aldo/keto reductase [Anaerolineaceae bacterium]MDD9955029.1 aldo/keto reductase [Anaerolineaceae bacterium]MDE0328161.1 aldo/keto reductase [Anaerolineaceae bacterium]
MQYTHPGRSGLSVSRLCLGTMNFGPHASEDDSQVIMDRALDLGINFFDTANRYGLREGRGHLGLTEEIIGRWWAQGGGRREKVVLATKLYGAMGDWPNEGKLSALNIRRACEASLRRLQTDHIDIYQMHHVDRETPWGEIWQGMEQLQREGKILYVGSSNFAGWHIAKAQEAAQRRNFMGLITEQCKYSLNERTAEMELLPACEDYGVGTIPWSPLGGGLLGGVLRKIEEGRRAAAGMQARIDALRPQLERYESFCSEAGEAPADVALAWLLAQPAVTAPIIGPRNLEQLEGSLRALEIQLDAEQMAALDAIWPGPGGPAPEAWAW